MGYAIAAWSAWAPGNETYEDLVALSEGKHQLDPSSALVPALPFASALATRRLSQLTKMCVAVSSRLLPLDCPLFFGSVNGDLMQQYKVNSLYAESGEMLPASFSLSVANTPVAEATILLHRPLAYTAIYADPSSLIRSLFLLGTAGLDSGRLDECVLLYADEAVPPAYASIAKDAPPPLAIALKLKRGSEKLDEAIHTPEELLFHLVRQKGDAWVI